MSPQLFAGRDDGDYLQRLSRSSQGRVLNGVDATGTRLHSQYRAGRYPGPVGHFTTGPCVAGPLPYGQSHTRTFPKLLFESEEELDQWRRERGYTVWPCKTCGYPGLER